MKNSLVALLLVLASSVFSADNITAPVSFDAGSSLTITTGVHVTGAAGSIWDFTGANIIGLQWAGVSKTGALLTDITGTASVRGMAKDVWIALRTDGKAGTGTPEDPFDGSTQVKLDAVFKRFYDAATTNITFHLAPGTYSLIGAWDQSWGMLEGWHVKGAGMNSTTVMQVVGAKGIADHDGSGAVFSNAPALNFGHQSVEDMTIDCAWFRSGPGGDNSRPHGNFQGVNLYGENPTVRNVWILHPGWADDECFGVLTSGGISDLHIPDNALLENVIVSNGGGGGNLTGMAMINLGALGTDASPHFAHNGRIIHCFFNLPTAGNAGGPPAGYDSGSVTDSTFIAYYHALFYDTFQSQHIKITRNSFQALYVDGNGILFNAGPGNTPCTDITIIDNDIAGSGQVAFASVVVNSTIALNRMTLYPGSNNHGSIFLDTSSVHGIKAYDNTIDTGLTLTDTSAGAGTSNRFKNNRDTSGALVIPDTDDQVAPLSLYVSALSGSDSTGTRLSIARPFLTINAAITAASSGDTVYVQDGTFNERLSAKNGVTVRFRPTAFLVNTKGSSGIVTSSAINQTFTVYHEHAPMICSGAGSIGILANHSGAVLNIHGDVSSTGSTGVAEAAVAGGTINQFGNVSCTNDIGVNGAGTITVRGNITAPANYAIGGRTGGTVTVIGGKVSGAGANAAVGIDANASRFIFNNCTIVSTAAGKPAIEFLVVGSTLPILRDCVLVAHSSATAAITTGTAQSILSYGTITANKGASPPTNITVLGGAYVVDAGVISDL